MASMMVVDGSLFRESRSSTTLSLFDSLANRDRLPRLRRRSSMAPETLTSLSNDARSALEKNSNQKINFVDHPLVSSPRSRLSLRNKWHAVPSATDSDKAATGPISADSATTETPLPTIQLEVNGEEKASPVQDSVPKKPLTAREKLRAARVLSRYTDSKPSKAAFGSKVLEALRASDGGAKRQSGLPQAPTNLFDDSKRGMPKQGLTFDLPGGADLFFIVLSFVLISTVMFTTTYVVWKLGAIHFNEY